MTATTTITEWYVMQNGTKRWPLLAWYGWLDYFHAGHSDAHTKRAGRTSESILVYQAPEQVEVMWMDELIDAFAACQLLHEVVQARQMDKVQRVLP